MKNAKQEQAEAIARMFGVELPKPRPLSGIPVISAYHFEPSQETRRDGSEAQEEQP